MAVNNSQLLGERLGNLNSEQQGVKANLSPNEQDANAFIVNNEQLVIEMELTVTKKVPYSDSFILDHPVQGELDSATLKLDGGYDATQDEVLLTYNS